MNNLKRILKNPRLILIFILSRYCHWIDDKTYLCIMYFIYFGKLLHLNSPRTFNEKLQWLKLYDRHPEYTQMVDKATVKEYVASIIGEKYIIPTLGVWENFDDIDFENIPSSFVLKCTHDSGGVVICENKNLFDVEKARSKLLKSMKKNYYYVGREYPYKDIKPRIIAEKYMVDESHIELKDYKIHLFHGIPNFIQVDFSATPYDITGSGQKRTKHYFPHIIVDYTLNSAIRAGLVKTIAIDKRKEIASLADDELEFKAIRDGKNVLELSDGQRLMLRAGLSRLQLLEEEFTKINPSKHPKMLVICEDTKVSPLVKDFLVQEGLAEEDVLQIDSDKKGAVKPEEWKQIKQSLFNIDKKSSPKVVVSVLMLREGFDVSNVCVIVPLRSSQAPILLEQVIGRGLRLMWREPDYIEIKAENRHKMLDLKQEPNGYYDILHIVEHPAFIQFYEDLDKNMFFEEKEKPNKESILGDMITSNLKENYQDYDFYIPIIIKDREEILTPKDLETKDFEEFPWTLEQLKSMVANKNGETFVAQEMMVKTRFGEYKVHSDIFNAQSYNDFLAKMINAITANIGRLSSHSNKVFPTIQINQAPLVAVIDNYIRNKLFKQPFNPMEGNNWRVLMIAKVGIVQHIMKQVSKSIYELQTNINVEDAEISKKYFSEVSSLKMRENFSLDIAKSIYEKTAYPSNKGEFEKDFLLFADADSQVERLLKINENYHLFANLKYIRTDGMLSSYYPDFMVKIGNDIYMVETKAQKDVTQENVVQKQKGALDWIRKTNELPPEARMNSTWHYTILDDNSFYLMRDRGASTKDMLDYFKLTNAKIKGVLL